MGGNLIKVTFRVPAKVLEPHGFHCPYGYEYVNAIYTYDVLDLMRSDPTIVEIIDAETGELLFWR